MNENPLLRCWRGEAGLARVFWLYGVAPSTVAVGLLGWAVSGGGRLGDQRGAAGRLPAAVAPRVTTSEQSATAERGGRPTCFVRIAAAPVAPQDAEVTMSDVRQRRWIAAPVMGLYVAMATAGGVTAPAGAPPAGAQPANAQPAAQQPGAPAAPQTAAPAAPQASAPAAPQASAPAAPQAQRQLVPAGELIGKNVRNAAGDELGTVDDVVLDAQRHRAHYVVIAVGGGLLRRGENVFAFPLEALQRAPGRGEVILDMPRDRLAQVPGFDRDRIPDWNDYLAEVDRFWNTTPGAGWTGWAGGTPPAGVPRPVGPATAGLATPGAAPTPAAPATPADAAGRSATVAGAGAAPAVVPPMAPQVRELRAVRASDMTGRSIRDGQQLQRIGTLRDIVLDLGTGDVEFAVIAFDQGWFRPDRLVTIPMDAFRRDERFLGELVLEMTAQQVAGAPSFEPDRWPQFDESDFRGGWDRFLSGLRADRGGATTPAGGAATGATNR
jgi:sporulation protein YlmC with PRC-barrel domain